jgi:hypothetical protein
MGVKSVAKGIRTCALLVLTTIAKRLTAICARLERGAKAGPHRVERREPAATSSGDGQRSSSETKSTD